ncbi:hypothetical protein ANCCAN_17578 [Ancylostoma caninum]|uniref:Uncharacterized protein n=1 Tax=Ancylostoma caninum TaxID=29170 RepID=A0A368G0L3_ANCCA|nr:hypothetical protein ANCCAN_17578 [Ancylostoma caninum]
MSGKVSSAADSHIASLCPVCQAVPMDKTDQFCRRCGCRLSLSCRYCNANIRLIHFPLQIAFFNSSSILLQQDLYIRSPYVVIGLSVVLGAAWLGLRYALKDKLK